MKRLLLIALIAFSSPALAQIWSLKSSLNSSLPACEKNGYFNNCHASYTWADGRRYIGKWKGNTPHGEGTMTYTDGDKYIGEYKDGKKNGQGTYTNIAGQSVTEVWEMGSYIGTKAEVDEQERARKAEEARKVQAKKEAEDKFKKIYNACLLDKSSKIDMQVMALKEALEATCEAIAKNPSWYEELKYN